MKKSLASLASLATVAMYSAAAAQSVAEVATPAVPKAPSKKSQALAIFTEKLTERSQGLFATNKEFRAAVLTKIQADLGVSTASAATMYNAAKKDAETADASVALGRDPKKEKAPSTGKRGRPAGSSNKSKAKVEGDAAALAEATAPAATETEPVSADATV